MPRDRRSSRSSEIQLYLLDSGLWDLDSVEVEQLNNIDTTTISAVQWGYVGDLDQGLSTTDDVVFNTVDGVDVSALSDEVDEFSDELKSLTDAEVQQLQNIDSVTISNGQWAYVGEMDQSVKTDSDVTHNSLTLTGSSALLLSGDATVFNDLRVALTTVKLGGVRDPGFAKWNDDGAGSTGIYAYHFDATTEEEVFIDAQLTHKYKEGSDIVFHVHWMPSANGAAGQKVCWGLEFSWDNYTATAGNTTIIYANAHIPADSSLVQNKHYITPFAAIDGTGKTISSLLGCRLFRDAAGVGLTDDYGSDAIARSSDFHIEMDTIGSNTAFTK